MRLERDLCTIRDWHRSDRGSLVECANNHRVWRNLTEKFPHPYTQADADWWFAFLAEMPEPTHWAIEVGGRAVGGVGLTRGEGERRFSGEFGYWLGEDYWGRGIATCAARATSDHILSHLDVVRLEATVYEWNPASMRVLEKCGFECEAMRERSVFKDGELIDSALYVRLA